MFKFNIFFKAGISFVFHGPQQNSACGHDKKVQG